VVNVRYIDSSSSIQRNFKLRARSHVTQPTFLHLTAMPGASKPKPTFNTLAREESFRNPTDKGSTIPILNEFVAPHIESFNALFDDSGLPLGDGDGRGLLSLGIREIGEKVAFDGNGKVGSESGATSWGNRMSSEFVHSVSIKCEYKSV
jgi:hypothetical protein